MLPKAISNCTHSSNSSWRYSWLRRQCGQCWWCRTDKCLHIPQQQWRSVYIKV